MTPVKETLIAARPTTHNADEWLLWLIEHRDFGNEWLAVQIAEALEIARPAFENLRDNQEQLDFDGSRVGVSRQALDETLAAIDTALSLREAK